MDFFGIEWGSYSAGMVTTVSAIPTKPLEPTEENVSGSAGWVDGIAYSLPHSVDALERILTSRVYEQMLTDPAVAASIGGMKLSILAGGMKLVSPVKQPAWTKQTKGKPKPDASKPAKPKTKPNPSEKDPKTSDKNSPEEPAEAQLSPEEQEAKEVLEFCERNAKKAMNEIRNSSFALLDAMAFRVKLSEWTGELEEEGPDAGKITLKSIRVKPNNRWYFMVDNKFNVLGILTYNPGKGIEIWPPEKFAWLSWMPRDSDPRGVSQLRAAHAAWNLKVQVYPEYYAHLRRFGSGGLDFEMPEGTTQGSSFPALNPATGTVDTTLPLTSASTYYVSALGFYKNGGTFVHPFGSKMTHWEPQNNGEAFLNAFRIFDEQILLGIQYEHTSTMDSKHSSRAQSETGQDKKGPLIQFGRDELAMVYYKIFHELVEINYGKDVADRCTPMPTWGNAEGRDKPELWKAAASIGYKVGPSQMQELDEELGTPIRDPEADAEAVQADRAHEAEMASMVKTAVPPNQPPAKGPIK